MVYPSHKYIDRRESLKHEKCILAMARTRSGLAGGLEFGFESANLCVETALAVLQCLFIFFELGDSSAIFIFDPAVVILDSRNGCKVLFVLLC